MPKKRDYSKLLIVEGAGDRHFVIGLMKHHTHWPDVAEEWPVYVEVGNGADQILVPGYLTAEIKSRNRTTVGVVLDADSNAKGCYQRIEQLCAPFFPGFPDQMPEEGLITGNADGERFGLWIMPDNTGGGDVEIFLRKLVPKTGEALWTRARNCVTAAIPDGAKCRQSHIPKANLYTWLAWQDPPGQSPGLALTQHLLDPHSEYAQPFVNWFKQLFLL